METKKSSYHHGSSNPEFRDIILKLKAEFLPQKIFLFGSRANGNARADSDYDFVIVVDQTDHTRIENMIRASELFRSYPVTVDAFIYPRKEFDEWKDDFNSIPEVAVSTGIEVDLDAF